MTKARPETMSLRMRNKHHALRMPQGTRPVPHAHVRTSTLVFGGMYGVRGLRGHAS